MRVEELQEIIVNNSIKSFNQGHNAGVIDERIRILELLREASQEDAVKIVEGK